MYQSRIQSRIAALILLSLLALSACNFPGFATPDPFPTFAAQTVEVRLTNAVLLPDAQDTPPAVATTPAPATATNTSEAPTATNSPIPTTTEVPCNRAEFVQDVTIPDGTDMDPGESFTKTWRLRNTGSCDWNSNYELLFKDGDSMGGPATQDLTGSVDTGETVDISVDLEAPDDEGSYKGFWWLRSDTGIVFGVGGTSDVPFFVEIDVVEDVTILSNGEFDLDQTYFIDFDTGSVAPPSGDRDMQFQAVSASEKYLRPVNGAEIKKMNDRTPSKSDCESASLSSSKISLDDVDALDTFCFQTSNGNYGRFEIESISGGNPQTMHIDYLTWDS